MRLAVSHPAPTALRRGWDREEPSDRTERTPWSVGARVDPCRRTPDRPRRGGAVRRPRARGGDRRGAAPTCYVPPSPDTANAGSPDPRTTAKITIPSLPDVVARYTGASLRGRPCVPADGRPRLGPVGRRRPERLDRDRPGAHERARGLLRRLVRPARPDRRARQTRPTPRDVGSAPSERPRSRRLRMRRPPPRRPSCPARRRRR